MRTEFFAAPCALILNAKKKVGKGYLVNSAFSNWVKLSDVLLSHGSLRYPLDCVAAADVLRETILRPEVRIDMMTSSQLR